MFLVPSVENEILNITNALKNKNLNDTEEFDMTMKEIESYVVF